MSRVKQVVDQGMQLVPSRLRRFGILGADGLLSCVFPVHVASSRFMRAGVRYAYERTYPAPSQHVCEGMLLRYRVWMRIK